MTRELADGMKLGWTVEYGKTCYIIAGIRKRGVAEPAFVLLKLNGADVRYDVPCSEVSLHSAEMFMPREAQFTALASGIGADLANL